MVSSAEQRNPNIQFRITSGSENLHPPCELFWRLLSLFPAAEPFGLATQRWAERNRYLESNSQPPNPPTPRSLYHLLTVTGQITTVRRRAALSRKRGRIAGKHETRRSAVVGCRDSRWMHLAERAHHAFTKPGAKTARGALHAIGRRLGRAYRHSDGPRSGGGVGHRLARHGQRPQSFARKSRLAGRDADPRSGQPQPPVVLGQRVAGLAGRLSAAGNSEGRSISTSRSASPRRAAPPACAAATCWKPA